MKSTLKGTLVAFIIAFCNLLGVNAAQRDNFPKYDIQKLCGEDKECHRIQLGFKENIKNDAVWFLVSDKARRECNAIARSVDISGDYWLLAGCLYIKHQLGNQPKTPFL